MTEDDKLGLGDRVEKAIRILAPGLADKVRKRGCNCNKRKEWLNNLGRKKN